MSEPKIEKGCIMVARKILTSEIWSKPPHYLKVWIYILAKAQHGNYKNLKRGQLITSIPEIIEECSWYVGYRKEKLNKSQVFQVLEWLRKPHDTSDESNDKATMITTTKATQKLLITIDNYDFYQTLSNYESNDEPVNEKVVEATREQRLPDNINKNEKNDNKNVKDNINIPYQEVYNHYLSLGLKNHRAYTKDMQKAIESAMKNNKYDIEYCKTLLDRHKKVVKLTEGSQYPVKARTLAEFFGQKVVNAKHLICSEYEEGGAKYETYLKGDGFKNEPRSYNKPNTETSQGKWAGIKPKAVEFTDADADYSDVM